LKLPSFAVVFLFTAISMTSVAADSPFAGTWKLNQEKSKLAGDTMSFASASGGSMRYTDSSETYTFTTDGKPVVTPFGSTVTWKESGKDSWESTSTRNGTLLATTSWKLSDDDKKLTLESKGTKPNGENFNDKAEYVRTAPGKGIAGSWVSKEVKLSSPNTLTMTPTADGGLQLDISDVKATVTTKFDGKDYPATGPTVPEGITLALTKTGPNSFKMVQKFKGKPISIGNYQVEADGKTMIEKDTDAQGKEPSTIVWEKEK
jgi:hypothetical protein